MPYFRIFPILEVQIGTILQHPAKPHYKPLHGIGCEISTPVLLGGDLSTKAGQSLPMVPRCSDTAAAPAEANGRRNGEERGVNRLQKFFAWKPLTAACRCAVRQLREVRRGLLPSWCSSMGTATPLTAFCELSLLPQRSVAHRQSAVKGAKIFCRGKPPRVAGSRGVPLLTLYKRSGKV